MTIRSVKVLARSDYIILYLKGVYLYFLLKRCEFDKIFICSTWNINKVFLKHLLPNYIPKQLRAHLLVSLQPG